MNRINEYFENLDKKNLIMLILSVIITCFIVIYYMNDYFNKKHENIHKQKIALIKKIRETNVLISKISKVKKINKKLKTEYHNLSNDLKYLLSEIDSSNFLEINNKRFLKILHTYIDAGTNVNASFDINKSDKLNKYVLNISGNFEPVEFFDFAFFLKQLQAPKAIITLDDLNISKNQNNVEFNINVNIWSIK